jgi:chemotaxis protein CheC
MLLVFFNILLINNLNIMTVRILTKEEDDQLKEVTNIGVGNASTALSTMIGKKVNMTVPESFVGGIEKVQRLIGSVDEKVVATFLKFHGEIEGAMVMILSPKSALSFVRILNQSRKEKVEDLDENDKSALQEMGNILLGASITAINKFLDLSLIHSIPDISVDKSGAVLDSVLIEMGAESGEILVFRVVLDVEEENVKGDFYYLFDPVSSGKILEMIKSKIK